MASNSDIFPFVTVKDSWELLVLGPITPHILDVECACPNPPHSNRPTHSLPSFLHLALRPRSVIDKELIYAARKQNVFRSSLPHSLSCTECSSLFGSCKAWNLIINISCVPRDSQIRKNIQWERHTLSVEEWRPAEGKIAEQAKFWPRWQQWPIGAKKVRVG